MTVLDCSRPSVARGLPATTPWWAKRAAAFVLFVALVAVGCGPSDEAANDEPNGAVSPTAPGSDVVAEGPESSATSSEAPDVTDVAPPPVAHIELEGCQADGAADCSERIRLDGILFYPWCVPIRDEFVIDDVDTAALGEKRPLEGFDPRYVVAFSSPDCGDGAWHLALADTTLNEATAIEQMRALCEVIVEPDPYYQCDRGGVATWREYETQGGLRSVPHYGYLPDYVAAVNAEAEADPNHPSRDPLAVLADSLTTRILTRCRTYDYCEVFAAEPSVSDGVAVVDVAVIERRNELFESTRYLATLELAPGGGPSWWLSSLKQSNGGYADSPDGSHDCCAIPIG